MDRRQFLTTSGTGAALLTLASSAAAQTRPPLTSAKHVLDITDFGIAAGDSDALAAANSEAVEKLLAWLVDNEPTPDLIGTGAVKVTAPSGHFRFARPWVVKCALWLEGQSNSLQFGYATHFDFNEGGFQLHGPGTNQRGVVNPPTTGAAGFRIENLYCTSRAPAGSGHHGFHAVTRGDFIRCTAALFPGDGFRIESETGFGASNNNANSSRILYCQAGGNGGNGIHLLKGDANCIVTDGCSMSYNGGFGLFDNAFLSNHHRGHHTEGNGLALVFPGHKIGEASSACCHPIPAWSAGATLAPSTEGTYRTHSGKLYRLLRAGGGATSTPPTHSTTASRSPPTEGDGYQWSYDGTTLTRRYHVALGQTAAASATVPGTNSAVWVPFEWAGPAKGIPLWSRGMSWKEGGSYCYASMAGETVWEACYEELGQPHAQIRSPALWIGGQSDPSPWSSCVQIKADQGVLSSPGGFIASRPFHDGGKLRALFGSNLSHGIVMLVGHESVHPSSFVMATGRDTYFLLDGQPANFLTFTGPLTGFTGGRSSAQPGVVNIPRLFVGSGASARSVDFGPGPPTAGHHAAGELVYNVAPTPGGRVGWVCTAAGTPGTWKAFGAIDP